MEDVVNLSLHAPNRTTSQSSTSSNGSNNGAANTSQQTQPSYDSSVVAGLLSPTRKRAADSAANPSTSPSASRNSSLFREDSTFTLLLASPSQAATYSSQPEFQPPHPTTTNNNYQNIPHHIPSYYALYQVINNPNNHTNNTTNTTSDRGLRVVLSNMPVTQAHAVEEFLLSRSLVKLVGLRAGEVKANHTLSRHPSSTSINLSYLHLNPNPNNTNSLLQLSNSNSSNNINPSSNISSVVNTNMNNGTVTLGEVVAMPLTVALPTPQSQQQQSSSAASTQSLLSLSTVSPGFTALSLPSSSDGNYTTASSTNTPTLKANLSGSALVNVNSDSSSSLVPLQGEDAFDLLLDTPNSSINNTTSNNIPSILSLLEDDTSAMNTRATTAYSEPTTPTTDQSQQSFSLQPQQQPLISQLLQASPSQNGFSGGVSQAPSSIMLAQSTSEMNEHSAPPLLSPLTFPIAFYTLLKVTSADDSLSNTTNTNTDTTSTAKEEEYVICLLAFLSPAQEDHFDLFRGELTSYSGSMIELLSKIDDNINSIHSHLSTWYSDTVEYLTRVVEYFVTSQNHNNNNNNNNTPRGDRSLGVLSGFLHSLILGKYFLVLAPPPLALLAFEISKFGSTILRSSPAMSSSQASSANTNAIFDAAELNNAMMSSQSEKRMTQSHSACHLISIVIVQSVNDDDINTILSQPVMSSTQSSNTLSQSPQTQAPQAEQYYDVVLDMRRSPPSLSFNSNSKKILAPREHSTTSVEGNSWSRRWANEMEIHSNNPIEIRNVMHTYLENMIAELNTIKRTRALQLIDNYLIYRLYYSLRHHPNPDLLIHLLIEGESGEENREALRALQLLL